MPKTNTLRTVERTEIIGLIKELKSKIEMHKILVILCKDKLIGRFLPTFRTVAQ